MKTIIYMEIKRYLQNPIFYIGAILVILGVYVNVSPYLGIHYFNRESEIHTLKEHSELADADIMDGYIPTTKEEQYEIGIHKIGQIMVDELGYNQSQKEELISKLIQSNMSFMEVAEYMEANYSFRSANTYFYDSAMKQANVEEANDYINQSLHKQNYSSYFSRKYTDYFSINILFYAILMFAFLFIRDSKRDMYELLHTKPMKARDYIMGKIMGGMVALGIVVVVSTMFFDVLVMLHGKAVGFPVSFWDLWISVALLIIPNLLMVISVYTLITVLFKSPLPAVPALILYMIYSNMGTRLENGSYGYKIRQLAIFVRFPNIFFETVIPQQAVWNQMILLLASVIIILLSIGIWKRRRVY